MVLQKFIINAAERGKYVERIHVECRLNSKTIRRCFLLFLFHFSSFLLKYYHHYDAVQCILQIQTHSLIITKSIQKRVFFFNSSHMCLTTNWIDCLAIKYQNNACCVLFPFPFHYYFFSPLNIGFREYWNANINPKWINQIAFDAIFIYYAHHQKIIISLKSIYVHINRMYI